VSIAEVTAPTARTRFWRNRCVLRDTIAMMGARAVLACVQLAAAATGCGGRLDGDLLEAIAADAAIDAPPVPAVVPVVRVHAWPGNGLQLLVELPDALAAETPGTLPAAWIELGDGTRVDAQVARAQVSTGLTAVVVLPSADPAEHARRKAAAEALIRALPAGERVALFVARDHAELLADLALPRGHALERLGDLAAEAAASALFATREAQELLAEVQSSFGAVGRAAIVVGDAAPPEPPEVRRVVQLLSMPVDGSPADDAAATVAALAARRAAILRIGACADLPEDTPFTLHLGTGSARDLFGPAPMAHLAGQPCVAADAAADRYPFPAEVQLVFTAEERQLFDQIYASSNENLIFTTSVRLGPGTPVPASAHLRGQGTLFCQRKSFNIELDAGRHRLMPEVGSARFFLISMCQDEAYFGQVFVDRLLQAQDLFVPRMAYVKVKLDGQNLGVYLMTEQPDNAIRDDGLAIQSVIRRRYDIDNQPAEVKYPSDPTLAAQEAARFEAIGDRARFGPVENLDADLGRVIDLDQYVRILATYSLVQNGDHIDEYYFYGSTEAGGEYYRAMGWDTDDAFSPCHGGGGRGIMDRCMLTYCAEAELDHALLRSPATYNRFLLGLDDVLARFTPAVMAGVMAGVKADLWAVLDDDETARALNEYGFTSLQNARATIDARMNQIMNQLGAIHASLVQRRAACPLTP
jgi:hypothetical protein